jgi:hypothetical protein
MNDTEREVIILNSAWEMIDEMVNWAMFVKNECTEPTHLLLTNRAFSRLFIIFLGDFLSEVKAYNGKPALGLSKPAPNGAPPSDKTFLFHIRQVCTNPKLGTDSTRLSQAVDAFAEWLESEFTAQSVNLSAIGFVEDLRITRIQYIQMCGDIAKHNLARLEKRVNDLCKLLKVKKPSVSEQDAYLAVEGFFEWFQGNIFIYHSSQIAEFLNNIRWSIYEYLQPEFQRSWHQPDNWATDFPAYAYHVPPNVTEPLTRAMYWNLMNRARLRPIVPRFVICETSKRRY